MTGVVILSMDIGMDVEQEFWPAMWRPCRPSSFMPMLSAYSIAVCTRVGDSVGGESV